MLIDEDEIEATYEGVPIFTIKEDRSLLKNIETEKIQTESFVIKEIDLSGEKHLILY